MIILTTKDIWVEMKFNNLFFVWILLTIAFYLHNSFFVQSISLFYVHTVILIAFAVYLSRQKYIFKKIFLIGLVAGFVELIADYFLVSITGTLHYTTILPSLVNSPIYMPFIWSIVITQLGYISQWVYRKCGEKSAVVIPSLLSMGLIGIYEALAFNIGVWEYTNTVMINHAPYFIILGEGIMFLFIHNIIQIEDFKRAGVLFGLIILGSYALTYLVRMAVTVTLANNHYQSLVAPVGWWSFHDSVSLFIWSAYLVLWSVLAFMMVKLS